jgi:hypothetical protein
VYASNAHGRYVAREEYRMIGYNPRVRVWIEVSRVYESEMLLPYPEHAWIERGF